MEKTGWVETAYEFPLNVRYGEVGHDGVASLFSLANWLQEAAGQSAASLGFGEEALGRFGQTWILTRLTLRIDRLPAAGESIKVRTWPSTLDRFGHRGYEVYDGDGTLIVSGGSAWNVMELSSRSLVQIPAELAAIYPANPRPCDAFTCRALPRLPETAETRGTLIRVRRDDLDINGHVNNARYLSWLMEPLPLSKHGAPLETLVNARNSASRLRLADITFRAECFPGDELSSLCAPVLASADEEKIFGQPAPFRMVHAIRAARFNQTGQTNQPGQPGQPQPSGEGKGENRMEDVCRAVTWWSEKPFAN